MTDGEGSRVEAYAFRRHEGAGPPVPAAAGMDPADPLAEKDDAAAIRAFGPSAAEIRAVEALWFWFMRHRCPDGTTAGRPRVTGIPGGKSEGCHPLDVFRVVDGLYRHRRLDRDHLAILGHYGRRQSPPDPSRRREQRAHLIWAEALTRLAPALRRRGLIP